MVVTPPETVNVPAFWTENEPLVAVIFPFWLMVSPIIETPAAVDVVRGPLMVVVPPLASCEIKAALTRG